MARITTVGSFLVGNINTMILRKSVVATAMQYYCWREGNTNKLSHLTGTDTNTDVFSAFPGYIKMCDLMSVPLLKHSKVSDVLKLMVNSVGCRGAKRFEQKMENDVMFVRATYGRRMERVNIF